MGYNHRQIIQAASNRKQKNRQMEIKENAENKVNILIYIRIYEYKIYEYTSCTMYCNFIANKDRRLLI